MGIREEAISIFLDQVALAEKLYPETDPDILFYRRYCIGFYCRPDRMLPCHTCQEENPRNTPIYVSETRMKTHCKREHHKATMKCNENNCTVQFSSHAAKELHEYYCHTKAYGWWMV